MSGDVVAEVARMLYETKRCAYPGMEPWERVEPFGEPWERGERVWALRLADALAPLIAEAMGAAKAEGIAEGVRAVQAEAEPWRSGGEDE